MSTENVTALIASIDYGPIIVGIAAIVGLVATVVVAQRGGSMLLSALRK